MLQALDQIRELLKASAPSVPPGHGLQRTMPAASTSRGSTSAPLLRAALQDSSAASDTFFADLGVYLTLERAQRLYGFQADRYGLDDAAAADIAAVFARVSPPARGWAAVPSSALWCSWQGPRRRTCPVQLPRFCVQACTPRCPTPPHPTSCETSQMQHVANNDGSRSFDCSRMTRRAAMFALPPQRSTTPTTMASSLQRSSAACAPRTRWVRQRAALSGPA